MLAKLGIGAGLTVGIILLFIVLMVIGSLIGGLVLYLALNVLIGLSLTYWQCVGISLALSIVSQAFRSIVAR